MQKGDLYLVNLNPTSGEETEERAAVVVLNEGDRKNLELAIVVPVTAWEPRWERHPFFVTIDSQGHRTLEERSAVDCFQLRSLSHHRFLERLGRLSESEMDQIKSAVALILDVEPTHCA